ncbi:MAG: Fic family protein, partial [Odoribacteraceae bacterium]|nr:Fic family protein [Odoribacteraceae bacterium]
MRYHDTPGITYRLSVISDLLARVQASGEYHPGSPLRRASRIRCTQGSLAIEGGPFQPAQVADVINGLPVPYTLRQLNEVRNAYRVYEHIPALNPFSVADLRQAHQLMLADVVDEAGKFRGGNVSLSNGNKTNNLAIPPRLIILQLKKLFDRLKIATLHPLVRAPIMHFGIAAIHPFVHGNRRLGRLWQTLVLARWNEILAWTPVEIHLYHHRLQYNHLLAGAREESDPTDFVDFILEMITDSLYDLPLRRVTGMSINLLALLNDDEREFIRAIINHIEDNDGISSTRAQILTGQTGDIVRTHLRHLIKRG